MIEALRELPADFRPKHLYGVEDWRDLDWMVEEDKIYFDVSGHDNLAAALIEVFDSQHCGAKRYDLALAARRRANAVYARSHSCDDQWTHVIYGMDMTPLLTDPSLSITEYTLEYVQRFSSDIEHRIARVSKRA